MVSSKLSILSALSLLSTAAVVVEGWTLASTSQGASFFDAFSFFTGSDPTHGFVQYVDKATATSKGLIYTQNNQVIIKTDNTTTTSSGRQSVRLVSTTSYNTGLFILDLEHMPTGCGTWPAFWMFGPNWPNSGEIDIIEGVNKQAQNQATLHTSSGCTMEGVSRSQTSTVLTSNCDVNAAGQGANVGCGVMSPSSQTYGAGFNSNKGGVYATQWLNDGIYIWFFPRSSIPSDIKSNAPNPNNWGTPMAAFPFVSGKCTPDKFANLQIVINLTFCGDWAGSVYSSSGCPSDCNTYVGQTPSAFTEAYWRINSLKVYH
ncbi:glycoside hydrolase family 16 protein [Mucor lusitanicus]|uniref:Glycoside hydrolase family 16 protein n=2 Tax=Mucor circinelloides f. lusitanicus TaxID=29924 RepID=A0A168JR86_MUCCL|nr:glycoside hydrolase family 16 protein [Mucor lusitanicus]OAD01513.1 glycoside hydrolase family 16 protein [Mucor lusitanicus CBS 277.49]